MPQKASLLSIWHCILSQKIEINITLIWKTFGVKSELKFSHFPILPPIPFFKPASTTNIFKLISSWHWSKYFRYIISDKLYTSFIRKFTFLTWKEYFTDEEPRIYRCKITCPRSLSQGVTEDSNQRLFGFLTNILNILSPNFQRMKLENSARSSW